MHSFLLISQSKIYSRLLSLPCMPHSLHILLLFFATPVSNRQWKLWNSSKCILFCPLPVFPVSSLCSQTQRAYKWQKTLPSLKSHFSCYSFHTSSYNPYLNKQNGLIKTQSNRSQITFHITYRLLYVSATRRHLHSSCVKQYKLPVQCTVTRDALYASPGRDPYRSCIVTFVYRVSKI